jgi:purine-binding chemotaxis protein CheW
MKAQTLENTAQPQEALNAIKQGLRLAAEDGGAVAQFLSFSVGKETYAVDIMSVQEIKGWSETTPLPKTPEYMRGVLNLRGCVIPVFDLRSRFGKGSTEVDTTHVVIVLSLSNGHNLGLLVDSVSDILTVEQSEIKPSPQVQSDIEDRFINGLISHENMMVILLDVAKLFSEESLEGAKSVAQQHHA